LRTRKKADSPADRRRHRMATQAVTLAGVVLIFGAGLVIGLVILIDGNASIWLIVAPTLGTISWLAVSLWKSAERLSLPTGSMAYGPAAIRAMTGQRLRSQGATMCSTGTRSGRPR
jgi:hypothetical protein